MGQVSDLLVKTCVLDCKLEIRIKRIDILCRRRKVVEYKMGMVIARGREATGSRSYNSHSFDDASAIDPLPPKIVAR